jgi:hypothetical protein
MEACLGLTLFFSLSLSLLFFSILVSQATSYKKNRLAFFEANIIYLFTLLISFIFLSPD